MTREHYDRLLPYDQQLRDVLNDTAHYSPKIQRIFMEVYTSITGQTISPSEWSCNACMLAKAKIVALYYVNGYPSFQPKEEAVESVAEQIEANKAERRRKVFKKEKATNK